MTSLEHVVKMTEQATMRIMDLGDLGPSPLEPLLAQTQKFLAELAEASAPAAEEPPAP